MSGEARRRAASLGDAAAPGPPLSAGSVGTAERRGLLRSLHWDGAAGGINASCSLRGLQAWPLFDGFMSVSAAPQPGDAASSSSLEAVFVRQAKGT